MIVVAPLDGFDLRRAYAFGGEAWLSFGGVAVDARAQKRVAGLQAIHREAKVGLLDATTHGEERHAVEGARPVEQHEAALHRAERPRQIQSHPASLGSVA